MSRLKECFKCKSVKSVDGFYKHPKTADGYLNKCKECCRRDATEHRNQNIEKVRAYDRERAKTASRIAHSIAVTRAIRSGLLARLPCVSCGNPQSVAHYDDYDKPLDVRWLCQACIVNTM